MPRATTPVPVSASEATVRLTSSSIPPLDYKRGDDQRRREAADELTALNQEMGLLS